MSETGSAKIEQRVLSININGCYQCTEGAYIRQGDIRVIGRMCRNGGNEVKEMIEDWVNPFMDCCPLKVVE